MFLGTYQHTIDDKGRLVLPKKFREDLKKECVVTRGPEHCLWVFPRPVFEEFAEKIAKLPISDPRNRSFRRAFVGGAIDVKVDGTGRIPIPEGLKQWAGLERDVTVSGNLDRIDLWAPDRYARETAEDDEFYAALEEVVGGTEGI